MVQEQGAFEHQIERYREGSVYALDKFSEPLQMRERVSLIEEQRSKLLQEACAKVQAS